MNTRHYSASFTVDQSPQTVFDAINNVRGWWSQAEEGDTDRLGAVFYHHYQDIHRCTLKIAELVPAYECYDVCSNAWGQYITGGLCKLITTGMASRTRWRRTPAIRKRSWRESVR